MATIDLPKTGVRIGYDSVGVGPPIVLLHAFPFSREMWRAQLHALSQSHTVISPDFPGFGETTFVPDITIEMMADIVVDLLDGLALIEPVVLGGCSMGGYVAFAIARRYPERVRKLILIDTKPEADDEIAKANRDKLLASAATLTPAKVIEDMIPKALCDLTRASKPEIVAEVRRIGAAQPMNGILAGVKALRDRPDAVPGLAEIRVPTLVIVGEHDAITPAAGAKLTASRIAGSTFVSLPDAGHLSNLENPEAFHAAVATFLSEISISTIYSTT